MNLVQKLIAELDKKEIGDGHGNTFFCRYTVLKTRWFAVYLHEFFRGDIDRCLHDHPWPFVSIIISDGYWEEMFAPWMVMRSKYFAPEEVRTMAARAAIYRRKWRRPGSILWRPAATAHRIDVEPGTHPWSLVIVGRKNRDWGFWTPTGWWKWRPGGTPVCEDERSS